MTDAASGELLGAVGLLHTSLVEFEGELGYWVRGARRRAGVARRALSLLVDWSWSGVGLRSLRICAAVDNEPSQRVALSLGFRPEAVLRSYRQIGERRSDAIQFGLTKPGWHDEPGRPDGIADAEVEPRSDRPPAGEIVLPAQPPVLADGELRLRPWRDDDLSALVAGTDEVAARWLLSMPWPYTEEAGRAFIAHAQQAWSGHAERNEFIPWATTQPEANWAITDAATDRPLGGVDLDLDIELDHAAGEIGYRIDPGARGKGIATRVTTLVARWALDELGLARLKIGADVENAASCGVARKAGFLREGTQYGVICSDGTAGADALFSLLPEDPRP